MRLNIDVLNDDKVKDDLHMLGHKAANPQPAFVKAGALLRLGIRR